MHKVGDQVMILPEKILREYYSQTVKDSAIYGVRFKDPSIVGAMYHYAGRSASVEKVMELPHYAGAIYRLSIDAECYAWTDLMFERNEPLYPGDPIPGLLNPVSFDGIDDLI